MLFNAGGFSFDIYRYIFGVWALARMPVESKSVMVL